MPIYLETQPLAFFWAPKNACTSVKQYLYHAEVGRPWDPDEWDGIEVHRYWRAVRGFDANFDAVTEADLSRAKNMWSFAVVRDPMKRLISAFSNRVEFHRDIEPCLATRWDRFWSKYLTRELDISYFFEHLKHYQAMNFSIENHTRPQSHFTGPDLARLDAVYRIEDIGELHKELVSRTGLDVPMPREQTGGKKYTVNDLSMRAYNRLRKITEPEYRYLGGLYSPPART